MKVSVITVTFNAASVVEDALASVAMQDYSSIEQVVVDGGSTDGTLQIVERYAGENFQVISEPDRGIYDAMNKGVQLATGEVILFLNADDRLAHTTSVSDLQAPFRTAPGPDIVIGDAIVRSVSHDLYRSHSRITPLNIGFEPVCHQALLAKKVLFDSVGMFDLQYRICADTEWLVRCADANASFLHVPRVVCWYATGGESDRHAALRVKEKTQILTSRRSRYQRGLQRAVSAWHRRISIHLP